MGTALARTACLSITSWFHHSDLDMAFRWEPLSRGTATLLRAPDAGAGGGRLALALSHHVAAPFAFPRLYPPEGARAFLARLSGARVRCSLELRCADSGRVRARVRLRPPREAPVLGHAGGRDVAALAVREADLAALAAAAAAAGAPLSSLEREALRPLVLPPAGAAPPAEGAPLGFRGHFLLGEGAAAPEAAAGGAAIGGGGRDGDGDEGGGRGAYFADSSRLLPRAVAGRLLLRSQRQVFARTRELLEEGMCGGAVVRADAGAGAGAGADATVAADDSECLGIIEGIVPASAAVAAAPPGGVAEAESAPDRARRLLAGAAVFVEAEELRAFLLDAALRGLYGDSGEGKGARTRGGDEGAAAPPWTPSVTS